MKIKGKNKFNYLNKFMWILPTKKEFLITIFVICFIILTPFIFFSIRLTGIGNQFYFLPDDIENYNYKELNYSNISDNEIFSEAYTKSIEKYNVLEKIKINETGHKGYVKFNDEELLQENINEAFKAFECVILDMPEMTYWTEGLPSHMQGTSTGIAGFDTSDNASSEQRDEMLKKIEEVSDELFEKSKGDIGLYIRLCYRYISLNVIYPNKKYIEDNKHSNDLYAAAINNKSQCLGVTAYFKSLMDSKGIQCAILETSVTRFDITNGHAINLICVNDKYIIVDPTIGISCNAHFGPLHQLLEPLSNIASIVPYDKYAKATNMQLTSVSLDLIENVTAPTN